jgi:di/tricarboxylate transporter
MKIALALGILVLSLIFFAAEWLPMDLTALGIAVLLMMMGLVTPDDGVAGFSNSATITVMAMFIVSAGISRTGALQFLAEWLFKLGGKHPGRQILAMGAIIAPIHCFINNASIVAVFLPLVEEWCHKRKISVSKLLMPLAYVTVLTGMITVIGTSTSILASSLAEKQGLGAFGLFQFADIGILTALVGLVYLAIAAPRLLPERKPVASDNLSKDYNLKGYVYEVVLPPGSNLIGQTLSSSRIQRKFDLDVLDLIRDGISFAQPFADKLLCAGDILIARGSREDLFKIRDQRGIDILPDVQFQDDGFNPALTSDEDGMAEAMVLPNSNLIGSTLKDVRFRQRYNSTVLAIRRGEELVRERLGKVVLKFGDLLLVQGPKQSLVGLQTSNDLLLTEQRNVEMLRRDKAPLAFAIVFAIVFLSTLTTLPIHLGAFTFKGFPIMVNALLGAFLMVVTGCLKPGEIYGSVRWDVIFVLAGIIPLGTALEKVGVIQIIADHLTSWGNGLSPYWLLTLFYAVCSVLSAFLSHAAAVVLMLPLAVNVAKSLHLDPMAFVYIITFASSNTYLTPIGYQTNIMVYASGGYKFFDFTRLGAPLHLLLMFLTPLFIIWFKGI